MFNVQSSMLVLKYLNRHNKMHRINLGIVNKILKIKKSLLNNDSNNVVLVSNGNRCF